MADQDVSKQEKETVYGDKTTVGDISDSKGVVIGDGTVVINENPRKPLLLIIGGLVIAIIAVAAAGSIFLKPETKTPVMDLAKDWDVIEEVAGDFLLDVAVMNGNSWFATSDGLIGLDADTLEAKSFQAGEEITALARDGGENGQIWFGTASGKIGRIDSNRSEHSVESEQTGGITSIAIDDSGNSWVAVYDQGIGRYSSEGNQIDDLIPPPDNSPYIEQLAVLNVEGGPVLWAVTNQQGVFMWKDGSWSKRLGPERGLPAGYISSVVVDEMGGSWFAHDEGIQFISFPGSVGAGGIVSEGCRAEANQIPPGAVSDLALSDSGLWLVTDHGIARKEIRSDDDSGPCEGWQIYEPDAEEDRLLYPFWRMDVNKDLCRVWLAANSTGNAYMVDFKRC